MPKTHAVDALCIAGHPTAKRTSEVFIIKKVRCHNRQIHKCTTNKGGYRKLNQSPYNLNGYRLFDKVVCNNKIGFVSARRRSGSYRVRDITWNSISEGITYRKLRFLETRSHYLCDKVSAIT